MLLYPLHHNHLLYTCAVTHHTHPQAPHNHLPHLSIHTPSPSLFPLPLRHIRIRIHRPHTRIRHRILMQMRLHALRPRIQFLGSAQIHRLLQQRVDVRVERLPVRVVEMVGLRLGGRKQRRGKGWDADGRGVGDGLMECDGMRWDGMG